MIGASESPPPSHRRTRGCNPQNQYKADGEFDTLAAATVAKSSGFAIGRLNPGGKFCPARTPEGVLAANLRETRAKPPCYRFPPRPVRCRSTKSVCSYIYRKQ